MRKAFLEQVANGIYPEEAPFLPKVSRTYVEEIVEPLRIENIEVACECCGSKTESNCIKKKDFLFMTKQEIYGFIHKNKNGDLVGGVEYLPAQLIPYNVPHDIGTAFITCVYMTDTQYDYKSAPLKMLERYLEKKYEKVIAISDEVGIFPNGDMEFFIQNGYIDEGIIFEDKNYCRLHLMSKKL